MIRVAGIFSVHALVGSRSRHAVHWSEKKSFGICRDYTSLLSGCACPPATQIRS
jgi:hypothetical protein